MRRRRRKYNIIKMSALNSSQLVHLLCLLSLSNFIQLTKMRVSVFYALAIPFAFAFAFALALALAGQHKVTPDTVYCSLLDIRS